MRGLWKFKSKMIFYDRGFFDQGRAFLWSRDTFKDQNQGSLFMVLAGF